ncbi:MAG TPA: hypothetical protein VGR03_01740 [Candidatus Acidoferrum sp.]|nr:hypothetical protein [Candidatus Acidoferrum sp.]
MRRMLLPLAVIAFIASAEAQKKAAPIPAGGGDIACGNQHYIVPGLCLQKCTGRRTLANLNAGQCFFAPQCKALQGDQTLKQFYNQGILHSGGPQVLPPDVAQRSVVAQIINVHYKPFNAGQFDIRIGNFAGKDAWAGIERGGGKGSKPILGVSPDLLLLTPGFLASVLGHEMVHESQYRRKYKTNMTGINSAVGAFRELEASMWELGEASSPGFPDNKFNDCLQESESTSNRQTRDCRSWQVTKAIENIRDSPRSYFKSLEAWMNEDPWVSAEWIPKNPNWKMAKAGPNPDPKECDNP